MTRARGEDPDRQIHGQTDRYAPPKVTEPYSPPVLKRKQKTMAAGESNAL